MNEASIVVAAREKKSAAELAAYLDQACAGDAELRQRVEELLQAREQPSGYEPTIAPSSGAAPVSNSAVTTARPLTEGPGTIIGRYKLLQKLGEGGMGAVYMAEQSEPVRRTVALKIIKPGMDTDEVITRFEAERQALALMDHQNIARVLDVGTTDSGRPYFVMELVRGVPFTKFCDDHNLSLRERLELFIPVCQAVQHAHQKGIIHRDIKPSNVLVTLYDDRPVPKVIDFGVAKAIGQRLTDKTMCTEFGQVVGTLEYMSPEQSEMGALDIDTRSDIYSLGVLLYEVLTGSTPIERKQLKKAAMLEMLRLIQQEEPPPPSSRLTSSDTLASIAAHRKLEPQRLCRLVKGDLDWIVMRALEKDRKRRYATAVEFAGDIERHLADQPVLACPPSVGYQISKFVRRNRGSVATAATLLAALIVGLFVTTYLYLAAETAKRAEAEQRHQAELERNHATAAEKLAESRRQEAEQSRDEAYVARQAEAEQRKIAERRRAAAVAVNKFLTTDMLTSADPEKAQGREITVKEVLDSAAQTVSDAFHDQPEIEAAVRQAIGKTYFGLAKYPLAEEQLAKSVALSIDTLGSEHQDTLEAVTMLASVYLKSGKLAEAETSYRKNLAAWREHFGEEHHGTVTVKSDLALVLRLLGKQEEAERLLREAVAYHRQHPGQGAENNLNAVNNLAMVLLDRGKMQEAEPLAREAVDLMQTKYGDKHPDTLSSMNTLARTLHALNRFEEAVPILRKILAQRRLVQGDDHVDTFIAMNNLGSSLQALGKLDEAEPLYRDALAGFRKLHGDDHLDTLALVNNLATFYAQRRNFAEAEPLFRQARTSLVKLFGNEHPMSLLIANNLAYVLASLDKTADAEALLRETLAVQQKVLPKQHPSTAQSLENLADVLRKQKQWDEAETILRELIALRREALPVDHQDTVNTLGALGRTLTEKGDAKQAEPLLREALAASQRAYPKQHPNIAHIQSLLGASLTALSQFEEAEPLLLTAYESMSKSPLARPDRLRLALEHIVQLYEAWQKPDRAAEWKKNLAELLAKQTSSS